MALSANQWLALFPSISNEMRLGIIANPPSNLDPADLFRAIIALEQSSRNALLQQIPKETLKRLIRSLPRDMQISVYSALSKTSENGGSSNARKQTLENASKPTTVSQNTSLPSHASTHNSHSSKLMTKNSNNNNNNNKNKNTRFQSSSTKLAQKYNRLTAHSKTSRRANDMDVEEELKQISALSDYDEDHDRIGDQCSKHVNHRQFAKEYFLPHVCKLMRSFGDSPLPSRYSALIILNHLKAYLRSLVRTVQAYHEKHPHKRTSTGARSRGQTNYFELMEKWYPAQTAMYTRWKRFKREEEKNNKQAPDLVNEDENDNGGDDGNDDEGDSDNEDQSSSAMVDAMRKEQQSLAKDNMSKVYIAALQIDVGWASRLIEWDRFTATMNRRQYLKFSMCRQSSLLSNRKRFYQWLQITNQKVFGKLFVPFLGFLAWDRVGCIVQIARKMEDIAYGTIIDDMDEFLRPTVIVQAILLLNQTKAVTPIKFEDASLVRVDVEHIDMSKYIEKEAEAEEKIDKDSQSDASAEINDEDDDDDDEEYHVQTRSKSHGQKKKTSVGTRKRKLPATDTNPAKKHRKK